MTETPEPPVSPTEHDSVPNTTNDAPQRSRWARFKGTNGTAAAIIGAAVVTAAAALVFGVGIIVGANLDDGDGEHHQSRETSEHHDKIDERRGERERGDGEYRDEDASDRPAEGNGDRRDERPDDRTSAPATPTTGPAAPPSSPSVTPRP